MKPTGILLLSSVLACPAFAAYDTPTPNPVSGAAAEYPMNEGAGTTLKDISGSGNNATFCGAGHNPSWSTYGLNFTATGECVNTPLTTFKTVLVHACTPSLSAPGNYQALIDSSVGSAGIALSILPINAAIYQGASAFTPIIWRYSVSSAATQTQASAIPPTNCGVLAMTLDASDHLYFNGTEYSNYYAQGASSGNVTTTGVYNIGGQASGSWSYLGNIDYAIFYPGVLTPTQIKQVTGYINTQVAARPGYPNPQLAAQGLGGANSLVCTGDSLTVGLHGSPWCNSTYMSLNNAYTFTIDAYSGRLAHDMAATAAYNVAPYISTAGLNKELLWGGTNDVCGSSFTAALAWQAELAYGQAAKAMGGSPIISTMISRLGCDTYKDSLNALIRANWQQGFSALDDIAAIPGLGADGANANPSATCFYSDNTHLMNTGTCYNGLSAYPVIGWNAARVINIMDGSTATNPTVTASNAYTQAIGDNYVIQTPTAAATDTLPDCTGLTGIRRKIVNGSGTYAITVNTSASQTITGSATVAANAAAEFTCELTSATAGGNYWLRTQ